MSVSKFHISRGNFQSSKEATVCAMARPTWRMPRILMELNMPEKMTAHSVQKRSGSLLSRQSDSQSSGHCTSTKRCNASKRYS